MVVSRSMGRVTSHKHSGNFVSLGMLGTTMTATASDSGMGR